jgi:fructose-bisphosphate aldolase class II
MKTLKELLAEQRAQGTAIGHFNMSELGTLVAIANAAHELNVPVMIGTSEGERDFVGMKNAVALIKNLREINGLQVFLNADHTHSVEKAKAAVDAGYDEILFDGGALPFEENIQKTKEVVEYARSVNPNIVVEGELGYIGSSSEVHDALPDGAQIELKDLTTAEEALRFVKETGVDLLAPAVGNFHGLIGTAPKLTVNPDRIREIFEAVQIPLVLHGGSGTPDETLQAAVKAGVGIVHISTELRVAWRKGMEQALADHPKEVAPYKLLAEPIAHVQAIIAQKIRTISH